MQVEWFSLSDNRKAAIVAAAQKVRSCNQAHKGFPFVLGHYREHIYGIILLEQDANGMFAGYDVRTNTLACNATLFQLALSLGATDTSKFIY